MRRLFSFLLIIVWSIVLSGGLFAAGSGEADPQAESLILTLDWVPNTNHIGAYVARDLGYFAEEGLDVRIVQPAEATAETLVAAGRADFGYSYQESVTFARTAEDALPVVALAAVIQHNTSGFASPADRGIETLADLVGKIYGGWGSPVETAMLQTLLENEGAGLDDIRVLNTGAADFFAASDREVDFSWVFEGWTVVEAEIRGVQLNYLDLAELDPVFDYYTPVIIASEETLEDRPETVRRFLRAMSRGYQYAISRPADAAGILVEAVPEISADLATASLEFLQDEFVAEAPRWGYMREEVWQRYADWLHDNSLIPRELDVDSSYTNDFLPQ